MVNNHSAFSRYSKGLFVGVGMIIPGVSGGTAAMICGIFEDILYATSNIIKHIKYSLQILIPITLGVMSSVLVFSKFMNTLCSIMPHTMHGIFCILTLLSTCFFIKNNIKFKYSFSKIFALILGVLFALTVHILLNTFVYTNKNFSIPQYFIFGLPLSVALILPGISFSYMLLVFGIYENVLSALYDININIILPLTIGVFIGAVLFSKILNVFLKRYAQETYCFILGFIIISMFDLIIC